MGGGAETGRESKHTARETHELERETEGGGAEEEREGGGDEERDRQ